MRAALGLHEMSPSIKPSILKLRELREQLCSGQDEWKQAFEARDFVISQLQDLHQMIRDRKVKRQKLEDKSSFILEHLAALPEPGEEKCDV